MISAHNYDATTSSGISRGIGASDLIVSLGSFTNSVGTDNEQAGTLMHELGHNLGLRHGGGDDTNFKSNYLSIMSYGFQLGGVIKGGVAGTFVYSRTALGSMTESNLNEPTGIGYGTRLWCPARNSYVTVANAGGAIDWNCNGTTTDTGVAFDVNNDGGQGTLNGFNDWANLKLKAGAIGLAGVTPDLPTLTEPDLLTVDVANQVGGQYNFTGFFEPVNNPPTVNTVKAGSAIPVKCSLHGNQGLNILATDSPTSQQVACTTGAPTDAIEQTVNAGNSSLSYDPATDTYTYVWKSIMTWTGSCRVVSTAHRHPDRRHPAHLGVPIHVTRQCGPRANQPRGPHCTARVGRECRK